MIEEVTQSICTVKRERDSIRATLLFPATLKVFAGHFPSHALVPGVYLIEAARQLSAELMAQTPSALPQLSTVRDARFTGEVLPDVVVEVTVSARPPAQSSSFQAQFSVQDREVARIRIDLS